MSFFKLPVPCIRGQFGQNVLECFQTILPPSEVTNILGHDPRSKGWRQLRPELREIYEYLQRKTDTDRREGTARYIMDRFAPGAIFEGAFPAISIGMIKPQDFEPYDPKNPYVGILQLDTSQDNTRILLDGLARVTGALDLLEAGQKIGEWFTFPLTIFAPHKGYGRDMTMIQLGQLFHDFNFRVTRVQPRIAIALDQRDLYIRLTNDLAQSDMMQANGGVELKAASLGKKSTALVVQQVLLRFVRGACEGAEFQTKNTMTLETPNLTKETLHSIRAKLEAFLLELANRMGDRFTNHNLLHLSAPGWQALGRFFHDMEFRLDDSLSESDRSKVMDCIAQVDWSEDNSEWEGVLGSFEEKDGKKWLSRSIGGNTAIINLTEYLRKKTGLDQLLASQQEEKELAPVAS